MSGSGGQPRIGRTLLRVALAIVLVYGLLGTGLTYWQVVQAQQLTEDPANPLVQAAIRAAPRGRILDARDVVLARNVKAADGSSLRSYPQPAAAPVVGYKSPVFGAAGLEQSYDRELLGLRQLTAADEVLRKFRSDPYDPSDLVLSLDLRLQQQAMRLLAGRRGAVVAIEPATGRILALASAPTFDPNRIVDPDGGAAYIQRLSAGPSEASPLLNRATQGRFTPGSVLKILTAIAGLGSGAITRETTYPEQPAEEETGFLVQGFRVRDGHHRATGARPLDLIEATEVSCNIYYARTGLATGAANMLEWSRRLGFGAPLPFDLPTQPSQLTHGGGPEGGFRDKVELANAAYGQGETFVTPLQMALVAATVANEGLLMKPKLVDELRTASGATLPIGPQQLSRVIEPVDAGIIKAAMQRAVEGELGKTFAGAAKVPGVPTAGKSGTAELGGRGEPHSWFIGFAPVDQPRIAVAVLVERGGFGREQAVPMGGQVMSYYLGLPQEGGQ